MKPHARTTGHRFAIRTGAVVFAALAATLVTAPPSGGDVVIRTIGAGDRPHEVAFTPDGSRAYVTGSESFNVIPIDTDFAGEPHGINLDQKPYGLAITPNGARAYVAQLFGGSVAVIDTVTDTVVTTVDVGEASGPISVAVTPDGSHVYIANRSSDEIAVISTATNTVTGTIPVGDGPFAIAFTPDGSRA